MQAALAHSVWQQHTPDHIQGRVFGVRDTVAGSMFALAYMIMPVLVENIKPIFNSDESTFSVVFVYVGVLTAFLGMFALKQKIAPKFDYD